MGEISRESRSALSTSPAPPCRPWMLERVIHGWRLWQSGKQRGLGERQAARRSREVGLGGGLRAVRMIPVIDLVQVRLQDCPLGVARLQLGGQARLLELARQRRRRDTQVAVADELLGQRRAALDGLPGTVI